MNIMTTLFRVKPAIKLTTQIYNLRPIKSRFLLGIQTAQHSISNSSSSTKVMMTEDEQLVHVQQETGQDTMIIAFPYLFPNNKLKQFRMARKTSEPLSASLKRIQISLNKFNKPKSKKKIDVEEESVENLQVQIVADGKPIDPSETDNISAWVEGRVLNIDGKIYAIKTNMPTVESLKLPSKIMANFIATPLVTLKNCTIDSCQFAWHRLLLPKEQKTSDGKEIEFDGRSYWIKLSEDFSYTPTQEDIAHQLKLTCYPMRDTCRGLASHRITVTPVEPGPIRCPFEKRHEYTDNYLAGLNDLRVVSYNILANLYADSDYSRTELFEYCPSYALDYDYRRQLLLKELSGYRADIICLQEVDRKEYNRTYYPFFSLTGNYDSVFVTKGGQVAEGTATIYRREKFELVESHRTILSHLIDPGRISSSSPENDSEYHPILNNQDKSEYATKCLSKFEPIRNAIISNPALAKRFLDLHTMVQTSLLKFREQPEKYLLIVNTHLYFAPDADHIRLLQGGTFTKYLEFLKDYYQEILATDNLALLLCGDMNSTPDCGLYKLLTTGSVSRDLPDWSSNEEEAVRELDIQTTLRFQSAYKNISYTNYTRKFNGCLDYIYYECDKLNCEGTVPLPDHEDVTAIDGIPSDVFPSDHLALIANLCYKASL